MEHGQQTDDADAQSGYSSQVNIDTEKEHTGWDDHKPFRDDSLAVNA